MEAKRQSAAAAVAMRAVLRFIRALRVLLLWLARQVPAEAKKEKQPRLDPQRSLFLGWAGFRRARVGDRFV